MRSHRWLAIAALLFAGCGSDAADPSNPPLDAGADAIVDAPASETTLDATESDALPADALVDTPDAVSPYSCPVELALILQTATVDDLYDEIAAGEQLHVVDVREPSETDGGIIEGAILMPWTSGVLEAQHDTLPTGDPLYIICRSGGRSLPASTFLVEQGHTCVFNVQGGMLAWEAVGYPTAAP